MSENTNIFLESNQTTVSVKIWASQITGRIEIG